MFRWDPIEDQFIYTGKSYILEGIRARWEMSKEGITQELRQRAEILEWMKKTNIRSFKDVAKAISKYTENPEQFLSMVREHPNKIKEEVAQEPEPEKHQKREEKDGTQ